MRDEQKELEAAELILDGTKLWAELSKSLDIFVHGSWYAIGIEELFKLMLFSKLDIQPPSRIEAAIRWFDDFKIDPDRKVCAAPWTCKEIGDFGRWVLGQPQDTWTGKDFGLVPNEGEVLDKETKN